MATGTYKPDPHDEITSVDGCAHHFATQQELDDYGGISWAALRDGAGTAAEDSASSIVGLQAGGTAGGGHK